MHICVHMYTSDVLPYTKYLHVQKVCRVTFFILKVVVHFTSDVFFSVSGTKNNIKMIASPPSPSVQKKMGFDFSAWHMRTSESFAVIVCELSLFGHILFLFDIYVLLHRGRN